MAEKETEGEKSKTETPAGPVITSQERELGQTALAEFNKGNYNASLQALSKLEALRPQDTKLMHNKAIVDYYKSDLKKTDQFRKSMNIVCGQAHINIEDVDSLTDVEHCVIYFNQAVLLFHMKQYGAALKIMNGVFNFIEPMEESLAHRVCLLLIELNLRTYQPENTLKIIAYVEKQFVSTETSTLGNEKDAKPLSKEQKEKKVVPIDAALDAFKKKLQHCKLRCYLMMHNLKTCKRELKNIASTGGLNSTTSVLKSNLEYLRGNFKKSIKLLNSFPQNSLSFKDCGESFPVIYYNSMGCIHHYMGKPNLATFYLDQALRENEVALLSVTRNDTGDQSCGRPLFTMGSNVRYELMYNAGVALLFAGKPMKAFDCLTEAVQVFHMNPRLWLRLAECCIMVHRDGKGNKEDFTVNGKKCEMVQTVAGSGVHKKIVLNPQLSNDTKYSSEGQSFAVPVATIEFASLCLRNALLLLPEVAPDGTVSVSPDAPSVPNVTSVPAAPSAPLGPTEVTNLRCSVLADSAYVSLCLGDYVVALERAKTLLAQPTLSGVHRFLGNLYCGEALIMMDKLSEAIDHLKPENIEDIPITFPTGDIKESEKDKAAVNSSQNLLKSWFPNTLPTMQAVFRYNLAVAHSLRGEFQQAGDILKRLWMHKSPGNDVPNHVIMLAIYIELSQGHADVARSIVKQHSPQYR